MRRFGINHFRQICDGTFNVQKIVQLGMKLTKIDLHINDIVLKAETFNNVELFLDKLIKNHISKDIQKINIDENNLYYGEKTNIGIYSNYFKNSVNDKSNFCNKEKKEIYVIFTIKSIISSIAGITISDLSIMRH